MSDTDWVRCPICNEPDMRRVKSVEGGKELFLIHCVNHGCRSNVADGNDDRIAALESQLAEARERVADREFQEQALEFLKNRTESETVRDLNDHRQQLMEQLAAANAKVERLEKFVQAVREHMNGKHGWTTVSYAIKAALRTLDNKEAE